MIKSLNTRLSALQMIGKVAPCKKMLADGIFISNLSYLISLWGGCEKYLIKSLQIVQNKTARVVSNTPTHALLAGAEIRHLSEIKIWLEMEASK